MLVLDEHTASAYVTSIAVSSLGHKCEVVTSVAAAVEGIDAFRPDALVYEWRLANNAGIGLGARLRLRAARCNLDLLLVVVSTQNEPEGFRARESVDAYFTKPFQPKLLASVLATPSAIGGVV